MNKKAILGLALVGTLTFGAGLGTMAWFTSAATSQANVFTTGRLTLDSPGTITSDMQVGNVYPGWSGTKKVSIKNSGTLDLKYKMNVNELNNILYNGTTPMLVTINGQGPVEINKLGEVYLGEIPAGETKTFDIGFRMPTTANNDYQNKQASFTFNFTAAQIDDATFTVKESINWIVDRSQPAGFETVKTDGKDAIKITIDSPVNSSSFYNTQGYKKQVNSNSSNWTVSSSLYVSNDMMDSNNKRGTGLWVSAKDKSGEIQAYPIIVFKNGDGNASGWYYFDDENGGYTKVGNAGAGWNDIKITCANKVISFYVNGSKVKEKAYDVSLPLSEYFLNTSNYGTQYSVYWTTPKYQIND